MSYQRGYLEEAICRFGKSVLVLNDADNSRQASIATLRLKFHLRGQNTTIPHLALAPRFPSTQTLGAHFEHPSPTSRYPHLSINRQPPTLRSRHPVRPLYLSSSCSTSYPSGHFSGQHRSPRSNINTVATASRKAQLIRNHVSRIGLVLPPSPVRQGL